MTQPTWHDEQHDRLARMTGAETGWTLARAQRPQVGVCVRCNEGFAASEGHVGPNVSLCYRCLDDRL